MDRKQVEEKVTEGIIAQLEKGVAPWKRPWAGGASTPRSLSTKKPYRGINWLILELAKMDGGYASSTWATFNQIKQQGGKIRKGQKATAIVFWKVMKIEKDGQEQKIPFLRYFNVFNLDQVEGIEDPFAVAPGEAIDVPEATAEIIQGYLDGPSIVHARQGAAFYRPSTDEITLPELDQFETPEGYASTLFHELVHSTGHKDRLDRFEDAQQAVFGCEGYAKEELVAELGAGMLGAITGISTEQSEAQNAAYVASWLKALKDDRSLLIGAAQRAQKALDRILGQDVAQEEEA
jgi:antirestriction protein ArdC